MNRVLDDHPTLRRVAEDLITLLDAKRVLEATQPATGMQPAVCEYLERTGRALMKQAGLPDEFVDVCIKVAPPRS
jgi:hypothetical protein